MDMTEYYDHLCACGCGERLVVRPSHKRYRIPKYVTGHRIRKMWQDPVYRKKMSNVSRKRWQDPVYRKKRLRSIRERAQDLKLRSSRDFKLFVRKHTPKVCACGCGRKIVIQKHHIQRGVPNYVLGHYGKKNWQDPVHRKKMSNVHKKTWQDHAYKKKMSDIRKKQWQNPVRRKIMSATAKKRWKDPIYQKKMSDSSKKMWQDPEYRNKMTKMSKEMWQDPEYSVRTRRAIMKAQNRQPTTPEVILGHILHETVPGEYEYTGDGTHIIAGFNPDFTNCNGQKKLVACQGDYWHTRPEVIERDSRKIEAYAKLGFSLLVIWEHELYNDPDKVAEKVKQFTER